MAQLQLTIDGMSCDHCVRRVTGALATLPGVRVEQVAVGSARVQYDPGQISPDAIVAAVDEVGYEAAAAARG